MTHSRIPLSAMSAPQRRLVEGHLPLVHLTLRRHRYLVEHGRTGREANELFQEGCLALIDAVRRHDPIRHGVFAAFCMARIHFAISRYAHEHQSSIRIPFITQWRRKKRQAEGHADRHRPDPLPRVVSMADGRRCIRRRQVSRRERDPAVRPTRDALTIGELLRERLDQAMRRVAADMKNAPRCAKGSREVVERCLEERWKVPEPEAWTPIRQLARSLGCSVGRITHCEERFRRKMAAMLEEDQTYLELRRLSKERTSGLCHHPTPQELAELGRNSRSEAGA